MQLQGSGLAGASLGRSERSLGDMVRPQVITETGGLPAVAVPGHCLVRAQANAVHDLEKKLRIKVSSKAGREE